jgi:hypothetical protein
MTKKEIAWIIGSIIAVILILLAVCNAPAMSQGNPKPATQSVKIDKAKMIAKVREAYNALNARAEKVLGSDPEYQQLFGLYRGLLIATDSSMMVIDSTAKK